MSQIISSLPLPNPGARDWPEDFPHENGCYLCHCHDCDQSFYGYKRRTLCKLCAGPITGPCEACQDKGWLLVNPHVPTPEGVMAIERCDACDKFSSDLSAAAAFFLSQESRQWTHHGDILVEPYPKK